MAPPKFDNSKWDERYASSEYVYGIKPNEFLAENVSAIPDNNVLCVADGECRNGVWLSTNGFKVTSIDFSTEGIKKSKKLAEISNAQLNTVKANLLTYSFGTSVYDAIISIYSHFLLEEIQSLHRKYHMALKPGGVIIFEAFSKNQLQYDSGGPQNIDLLYDKVMLMQSFPMMDVLKQQLSEQFLKITFKKI